MNKKRIRQLTGSLLRRAATQPAARYLGPRRALLRQWLEEENYLQRFIPLCDGRRISCAAVLDLCQEELDTLSPCPEEGWLAFTYDFARKSMFPEPDFEPRRERHGPGAVFFLSLLQALLTPSGPRRRRTPCGTWCCWRRTSWPAALTRTATGCFCVPGGGNLSMR